MLLTVVQGGSMTKPLKPGRIQPAVSEGHCRSGHTLGIRLLDRGPRGVHATPYCTCVDAGGLAAFDELRQGVLEIRVHGRCRRGRGAGRCAESFDRVLASGRVQPGSPSRHPGVVCTRGSNERPITLEIRELRSATSI